MGRFFPDLLNFKISSSSHSTTDHEAKGDWHHHDLFWLASCWYHRKWQQFQGNMHENRRLHKTFPITLWLRLLDFWDHFQETTAWRNSTIGDYEAHEIRNESGTGVSHFKGKSQLGTVLKTWQRMNNPIRRKEWYLWQRDETNGLKNFLNEMFLEQNAIV